MKKKRMGDQVLDYSKNEPPEGYICSVCGATHVKLWRQYQTFLDQLKIMCARCAALDEDVDITTINEEGKREGNFGLTDWIGNLVPAIPTEQGDTYWGYTSVPQKGILWWVRLPTLTNPDRKNNMSKEFEARFDLRVDMLLKKKFKKFCKDNNIKLSDAGREAMSLYIHNKAFVNTIIENLQDTDFYTLFYKFFHESPIGVQEALSELVGPAEEQLIQNTPPQLLRSIHVITKRGKEALEKML